MWKKNLFSLILNNGNFKLSENLLKNVASAQIRTLQTEVPVKEVNIPVKWGHLAARLWGNENEQPILALHGWQDNAGTWDTLAPLLCHKRPILAIDFPGHGLSSWIPAGMHYYTWDLPRLILYLKNYFKWNKLSLLCHSMGSIAGMRYASIFPEEIAFYIAIDSLIYDDYDTDKVVNNYATILKKIQGISKWKDEPPSYTMEEIIKIWHLGTTKSIAMESVPHLLKRGSKPSSKDPNKYYFSRDPRLKQILFTVEDKKLVETLAKKLTCPTLYIKGTNSPFGNDEFAVEMRELIAKNNNNFESHFLPGTHHLHLNTPELLAPLILNFMDKFSSK
ncbi:hypothetical protein KGM_205079 [Danaus plexippus plexippus]|uniref:Uncharacterized protein n=1 Tax=Danaus plexippus plexippus TaxID=278856 RepID=A0A212EWC6_DANPL|nr:probable serine hydrolase [Danaus plexippus plexippus]OWR45783.1 hypothetical protein KGM_205079 [Danaus plexippus plexippus]